MKALHVGGAKEHVGVGARLSTITRLISRMGVSTRGSLENTPWTWDVITQTYAEGI